MNPRFVLIIDLLLAALLVTACNALPTASPTPFASSSESETHPLSEQMPRATNTLESKTQVPTITPVANPDLFLPTCKRDPKMGLSTETSPGKYQGWYLYTNEMYEFSLAFPPDWELIEEQNYICLRPQSEPTIILVVGFKQDTEDIAIQRTGVGAGDIFTTGKVNFLGQEISRDVLRYQGKDKTILYNYGTEIKVDRLAFTLSLDDFRTDYNAAELSNTIELIADTIVESFELTK